jgi:hypothetical protein
MTTYRNFRHLQPAEDYALFFEDFHIATAAEWTVTKIGTGTNVITPGVGGQLLITNSAADNDAVQYQLINETFKYVAGKKLSFKARFKVLEVIEMDLLIGLAITDTTVHDATDGIWIKSDDGDALLDFQVVKNSTASSLTGFATAVADTWCVVEFYYDGGSDIDVSFNGVRAGSLPLTNAPDDEDLTVTFSIRNGQAVANILTVDYILVQEQR